jgi:hypothetical protein
MTRTLQNEQKNTKTLNNKFILVQLCSVLEKFDIDLFSSITCQKEYGICTKLPHGPCLGIKTLIDRVTIIC